jgi:hypothetical protein
MQERAEYVLSEIKSKEDRCDTDWNGEAGSATGIGWGYHGGALGRGLPAGFTAVNRGGIGTGGSNGVFDRIDLCPQNVDSKEECRKIRKNNKFQKWCKLLKEKYL